MEHSANETAQIIKEMAGALTASKNRIRFLEEKQSEPIAIISMACRFPGGANSPEALWELLNEGRNAITEVPAMRWDVESYFDSDPEVIGKTYTKWGGFLGDVKKFDAAFFGISPKEAKSLDPQQRLLLEITWEMLERGYVLPASLKDSKTGVYVGIWSSEYHNNVMANKEKIDAYSFLGTAHSTTVGRISYWLGLQGPNMPIDTACSSSLVALHLACQGLRNGDCDMALTGGVNLILAPDWYIYLSKIKALSPTGKCHTFSNDADGFVRAEGCGMFLLKRLRDAKKDGDEIHAVIKGSAVNQDGASSGFTAPNGPSQQAVIRKALANAQVEPSSVSYVECHGTGTELGDPIEVQALAAVYGEGREEENPISIGSIKSNIGHTESAAGIAGVIKSVLALQNYKIPKTLHVGTPNTHIPWDEFPVQIAEDTTNWVQNSQPRRAGVSSFGFSGTNAHVILEEAPEKITQEPEESPKETVSLPSCPLTLSAKSTEALQGQAGKLLTHIEQHPDLSLRDVSYSLGTTRTHFDKRVVIAAKTKEDLQSNLKRYRDEGRLSAKGSLTPKENPLPVIAMLFTGQGSQLASMGHGLYETCPVFKEALDVIAAKFDEHLETSLLEVLFASGSTNQGKLLHRTAYTQPSLFAVEVSLYRLFESWGIQPQYLIGHSIGELAAAHVAGVFSLEDACTLVANRGKLMEAISKKGAMASLQATEDTVLESIFQHKLDKQVSIAALNGPQQTVISGDVDAIDTLIAHFTKTETKATRLTVSHAFHSHHMNAMLDAFREIAESITYHPPKIALISNVSGERAGEEVTTADYWVEHVRCPVRFLDGMKALEKLNVNTFFELGPQPVLCGMGANCLDAETKATFLPTLRKGKDDFEMMLKVLAELHVRGVDVNWPSFFKPYGGKKVPLPTYAFQRKRYWLDALKNADLKSSYTSPSRYSLAGECIPSPGGRLHHILTVSAKAQPWLADHVLVGYTTTTGTFLLASALSVMEEHFVGAAFTLKDVSFLTPIVVKREVLVHLIFNPRSKSNYDLEIFTVTNKASGQANWICHLRGEAIIHDSLPMSEVPLLSELNQRSWTTGTASRLSFELHDTGLLSNQCWVLKESKWDEVESFGFVKSLNVDDGQAPLHPVLLENCLWGTRSKELLSFRSVSEAPLFVPFTLENLTYFGGVTQKSWYYGESAVISPVQQEIRELKKMVLYDESGQVSMILSGFALKHALPNALLRSLQQGAASFSDVSTYHTWLGYEDPPLSAPEGDNIGLAMEEKGKPDGLRLRPYPSFVPDAGEVQIEVKSAGMNFREVLMTLGIVELTYQGEKLLHKHFERFSKHEPPLGGECSGLICRIGDGVEGFKIGDRVMAFAPGSFCQYVTVDAHYVCRIPETLGFEEAATIPVAFLTAWYGLKVLGGLARGERILIHAAAGGVGMAAVQIANHLGAEIFATASPSKWWILEELGIKHIMHSRNTNFSQNIPEITDGEGVDMVLNALSRDFVDAGLGVLRHRGRFLEMGKTDIRDPKLLKVSYPDISYLPFDLFKLVPRKFPELYQDICSLLISKKIKPLFYRSYPITNAKRAFRTMAKTQHVGKLVLRFHEISRKPKNNIIVLVDDSGPEIEGFVNYAKEQSIATLLRISTKTRLEPSDAESVVNQSVINFAWSPECTTNVRSLLQPHLKGNNLIGVVYHAQEESVLREKAGLEFLWQLHKLSLQHPLDFFTIINSTPKENSTSAFGQFLNRLIVLREKKALPIYVDAFTPSTKSYKPVPLAKILSFKNKGKSEIEKDVIENLASVLILDGSDIDISLKFLELGADSIVLVEFTRAMNVKYGTNINATVLYDYTTPAEFIHYLYELSNEKNN